MASKTTFKLTLGRSKESVEPVVEGRPRKAAVRRPQLTLEPRLIAKALRATPGIDEVVKASPNLLKWPSWFPVATFTACQKTGTALWLDVWDADHFDLYTDMARCLADCRIWFSANGFTTWDSPQTKTGRICMTFRAPTDGDYVCHVQLQSDAGPATVDCMIDSFDFGPLPFNGSISQPHPAFLSAGLHQFKIHQLSGSYFFVGMSVWRA